ncbi:hypothetical protein J5N97_023348 [Dioscorea zingiberensis]|uniref:Uncharacterized protein n=1 Tax=Dioscorea zingiberensis TaxID=325984 RepID=A0A9D5HBF8_9LILI|nr:hypothetical protein J5N97_023348 [Dioscorea zingiberensis]
MSLPEGEEIEKRAHDAEVLGGSHGGDRTGLQPGSSGSTLSERACSGDLTGRQCNLLPCKNSWKRFRVTLRSKLRKVRLVKPIKQASAAMTSILGHHQHQHQQPRSVSLKLHHQHHRSFKPVYVDELFNKAEVVHVEQVEITPQKEKEKVKVFEKSSVLKSQAGTSSSSSSSFVVGDLNEVDLRAEVFIAKFKEEMRLQRQRSFGEYQEMLARGV